jgi:nitroreductase
MSPTDTIDDLLQLRFDDSPQDVSGDADTSHWLPMANHQSCRLYTDQPVPPDLVRQICALALSSPTKSDLQQRDIIIIDDPDKRATINALFPGSPWIEGAPVFLVFCGNNRRLRQIHARADIPFENDHLDAFFNAAVDAGIALGAFVNAADAAGLGTCPISTIRDHLKVVNELLGLPDWVFPVAGMTLGWPARTPRINLRLPLAATVHTDSYNEAAQEPAIHAYDQRRAELRPYGSQREPERFGTRDPYTWSDDKARQYNEPQRSDFGDYIRRKGFKLT